MIFNPEYHKERLEHFLSAILDFEMEVLKVLPVMSEDMFEINSMKNNSQFFENKGISSSAPSRKYGFRNSILMIVAILLMFAFVTEMVEAITGITRAVEESADGVGNAAANVDSLVSAISLVSSEME